MQEASKKDTLLYLDLQEEINVCDQIKNYELEFINLTTILIFQF